MSSASKVKQYIINYLNPILGSNIQGEGSSDTKINKQTEATIGKFFDRYITGNDGDVVKPVLLIA